MLRTLGFAAAASLVSGSASDFPAFDAFHANCALTTVYDAPCHEIFANIKTEVNSWSEGGPSHGLYKEKEEAQDVYLWTTRTTPKAHYVDDIIFEMQPVNDATCTVNSKSRSQSFSYYDYNTNFCNMWNVLSRAGDMKSNVANHCKFQPDNIEKACAKY
eukprot:TRINITY_DN17840_c0_g1_i1.p1 TRINITY_DN17840_c0_g1~~TRINITY_DN17840_c0_g1_i1.p1  ORF type:complete len:159 (+),score=19.05 TRINITY_DN17840_c0_g1_i1:2-478(+)